MNELIIQPKSFRDRQLLLSKLRENNVSRVIKPNGDVVVDGKYLALIRLVCDCK